MSADVLRRAAAKLREAAEAASEGPWTVDGDIQAVMAKDDVTIAYDDETGMGDAAYIALMHPDVGLAIAAWLDETAKHITEFADIVGLARSGDLTEPDEAAIAAAYEILREAPDVG